MITKRRGFNGEEPPTRRLLDNEGHRARFMQGPRVINSQHGTHDHFLAPPMHRGMDPSVCAVRG